MSLFVQDVEQNKQNSKVNAGWEVRYLHLSGLAMFWQFVLLIYLLTEGLRLLSKMLLCLDCEFPITSLYHNDVVFMICLP